MTVTLAERSRLSNVEQGGGLHGLYDRVAQTALGGPVLYEYSVAQNEQYSILSDFPIFLNQD